MPIYEYKCKNCGNIFEVFQQNYIKTSVSCPKCHKSALIKIFKPVTIIFKGKGFYKTDHD